jgi:hypothetical protein
MLPRLAKGIAMNVRTATIAALLMLGCWTIATAADDGCAAPVVVIQPGGVCTTCDSAPMARTKMRANPCQPNWLEKHHPLPPMTVNLCPGACYGYFPTQWRRWEDHCPYPFTMLPDPQHPTIPPIPSSDSTLGKNGKIPDPRPIDPKKMKSSVAPLNMILGSRIN